MAGFSTPEAMKVLREARDHAGIKNRQIADAINTQQRRVHKSGERFVPYDEERVKADFARRKVGQEVIGRLIEGTLDAITSEDTPARREAARWLTSNMERMGLLNGPFGSVEIAATRILKALSPKILRQDPTEARDIVVSILRDEFGPVEVEVGIPKAIIPTQQSHDTTAP
jgi:hypothetical protein